MGAPKIILPPGYQPELDRLPPRPAPGCYGLLIAGAVVTLVAVAALLLIAGGAANAQPDRPTVAPIGSQPAATFTPRPPRPTLDPWSMTGTALLHAVASPTLDYCWWLTATPTATPTARFTPDSWSATGTAMYEATNPPQTPTATPDVPRAWCNNIPTATITDTPAALSSPTPAPTQTRALPTAAPVIPVQTIEPPVVVIIPTLPPTLELPTAQPTSRPTRRPKPTATPTATTTPTPTATLTPTPAPVLVIVQADCTAGYPVFMLRNDGGGALGVIWYVVQNGIAYGNGVWELIPPGLLAQALAPAAAGVGGTFELWIDQPWLPVAQPTPTPPAVTCYLPTATEPPTLTPTPTETPTPEPTQEQPPQ